MIPHSYFWISTSGDYCPHCQHIYSVRMVSSPLHFTRLCVGLHLLFLLFYTLNVVAVCSWIRSSSWFNFAACLLDVPQNELHLLWGLHQHAAQPWFVLLSWIFLRPRPTAPYYLRCFWSPGWPGTYGHCLDGFDGRHRYEGSAHAVARGSWRHPSPDMPVAAAPDLSVTGALSSLVDTNVYPGEAMPTSVPMHTTPLGADLSDKLKGKIWSNEFVDFVNLTRSQPNPSYTTAASPDLRPVRRVPPTRLHLATDRFPPSISGLLPFSCLGLYTPKDSPSLPRVSLNTLKLCATLRWQFRHLIHSFEPFTRLILSASHGHNPGGTCFSGACTPNPSRGA